MYSYRVKCMCVYRVKELKEQLDNVQQQLSRKNMEMELAYEEQKT